MKYRKWKADGYLVIAIDMRCSCASGEVLSGLLKFDTAQPRDSVAHHVRRLRAEMRQEMQTHERAR